MHFLLYTDAGSVVLVLVALALVAVVVWNLVAVVLRLGAYALWMLYERLRRVELPALVRRPAGEESLTEPKA